ncbi:hypothetical protein CROQUDRAFT_110236 [Cronartium quercuum f. sp. fusiforme G11]|uniref:Uncharacterized protein n=1 Tax=Cronartium quercuum f. sp. fusiforme G11 TaxID=708437 RepID=A0A9P6N922_9BASI|nr:hypothetical protein CROQUDRAFT_110236 [Cronartium quercuum f. sp. fusiforme G11]
MVSAYTNNMQGPSLSESNADMDRGFPAQATGSRHTGSSMNRLHGPSDEGSGTMQPVPLLIRMDIFYTHHQKVTEPHAIEESQVFMEKFPSPLEMLNRINQKDLFLENAFVGKVLELPKADDRWIFSKEPANGDKSSIFSQSFPPGYPNVPENLKDFIDFKLSQGMKKQITIIDRIITLFLLLWNMQPFVAEILKLDNSHDLQIKSFETLASILQHDHYAKSPQYLPKPQINAYKWYTKYTRGPSENVRKLATFNNEYFRLYHCIYIKQGKTDQKKRVIRDITYAMLDGRQKISASYGHWVLDAIDKVASSHGDLKFHPFTNKKQSRYKTTEFWHDLTTSHSLP